MWDQITRGYVDLGAQTQGRHGKKCSQEPWRGACKRAPGLAELGCPCQPGSALLQAPAGLRGLHPFLGLLTWPSWEGAWCCWGGLKEGESGADGAQCGPIHGCRGPPHRLMASLPPRVAQTQEIGVPHLIPFLP